MKKQTFFLIAGLWLVLFLFLIGNYYFTALTGTTIFLKTMPYDPHDFFRGDYIYLNYELANQNLSNYTIGETIYVTISIDENGFAKFESFSKEKPSGLYIKGKVSSQNHIDFGIEKYFIEKGSGRKISQQQPFIVEVKVDRFGNSILEEIYDNNFKPLAI
jgi:uncharacterized membrane-anchored protein